MPVPAQNGFQVAVNLQNPPAIQGDFASSNPRRSMPAPPGGYVAGVNGLVIGNFCWVQSDGLTLLNSGSGTPDGFVHNELQALITAYLGQYGMTIPYGLMATAMSSGDYYANTFTNTIQNPTQSTKGQKAFANVASGIMTPAAAGSSLSTAWVGVGHITINASGVGGTLTVESTTSGTLAIGSVIYSGAAAGTIITSGSGASWQVNNAQTVANGTAMSAISGWIETPFFITRGAPVGTAGSPSLSVISL